jgi:hypothetical protein
METLFFSPDGGAMRLPENVPTLLQKPLTKLQKLSCVAGVSSGNVQDDVATVHVVFSKHRKNNRKRVLSCFAAAGVVLTRMHTNPLGQFMQVWLKPSKTLTH